MQRLHLASHRFDSLPSFLGAAPGLAEDWRIVAVG
jgi:hypothetical protein